LRPRAPVEEAARLDYVLLAVPWRSVESALKGLPATSPKLILADRGGRGASEVVAALAPGGGLVKGFNSKLSGGDPMIPESVRLLVSTGPLAHLTTLNSNGSPQVTVVWIGIEDDEFVSAHLSEHRKVRNVRNDGRVALSFLGKGRNPQGLLEYV